MVADRSPNLSCRSCGYIDPDAEAGSRCPNCEVVLVPARVLERFPDDPLLGRTVGGKYAVISLLGIGGFGAVYRAVQEPVGRHVALKVVHAEHVENSDMQARFFREAKVVASLSDPAVVTLFDYGDEPETGLYMVFELVSGRSLGQILDDGPRDPVWVTHVLLQVLRALSEAHELGMIHRDIKPANIMVSEKNGRESVRLLDFGIAKVGPRESREASLKTQEGTMLGTPQFMSPEQARAAVGLDARTDLYSLAVVGYTLISGANPFERDTVVDTIMAHVLDPVPPLRVDQQVPPALSSVLAKAMEKDPDDRFGSAREMADALEAALPNVAFPSLRYEFRGIAPASTDSLLGAAEKSLGAEAVAALVSRAAAGGASSRASASNMSELGLSEAFGANDSAAGGRTDAASASIAFQQKKNRTPLLVLAFGAALAVLAGVLFAVTDRQPEVVATSLAPPEEPTKSTEPEPSEAPAKLAPLPAEPVPRAVVQAERGLMDDAERTLARALAGTEPAGRVALYAKIRAEPVLAPLLDQPILKALEPKAPPKAVEPRRRRSPPQRRRVAPPPPPPPKPAAPAAAKSLEVPEF